jgi:hypothetical protein
MSVHIIKRDGIAPVGIVDDEAKLSTWFQDNAGGDAGGFTTEEGEPDCRDVDALLCGIADRIGLTMAAEFVPFSRSRNAQPRHGSEKPWESLNWKVTLQRGGRDILSTDYSQGTGHAPAYALKLKNPSSRYEAAMKERAIAAEIETGRIHQFGEGLMYDSRTGLRDTRKPIAPPSIGDVLQSLAMDAAVLNYASFEDWAADHGYDSDSRTAESTYRECLAIALAFRAGLGDDRMSEIALAASFN